MLENYGKVLEADVLVIGHGIAGLSAAISVKEENPDLKVITVDKAYAGYAGKARTMTSARTNKHVVDQKRK